MVPVQQQVTHNPLLLLVTSTATPKLNLLAAYDCTHNYIFRTNDRRHVTRVMVTAKELVFDNFSNSIIYLILLHCLQFIIHIIERIIYE